MVVGLVASLVSTLVHSSKSKNAPTSEHSPSDQTAYPQQRAHGTSCAHDCSICAVVPSLATRHERKQERKDRRCARRMDRHAERDLRRGRHHHHYCQPAGVVVQPTVSVGGYPTMSWQSYGGRRSAAAPGPRAAVQEEGVERGLTEGDMPPPYEAGPLDRGVDEKVEIRQ
ncbi:hypothetical protein ACHAQA_000447 [Verticillium albo-atrum]